MGQSVSVDSKLVELRDLFCLGRGAPQKPCGHPLQVSARHHVKAWKFEGRERGRVVDSAVELCDGHGMFRTELQETCSYVILHVWAAGADADEAARGAMAATLEDLAASAGALCTPRGLTIEVASHSEARSVSPPQGAADGGASLRHAGATDAGASLRYAVFVWHGVSVDPLVKAHAFAKAFELDRLLRVGLMWQRGFLEALSQAVVLKGAARGSQFAQDPGDGGGRAAAANLRRSGNRLLTSILEGAAPVPGAAQPLSPDSPTLPSLSGCGGAADGGADGAWSSGGSGGSGRSECAAPAPAVPPGSQRFPRLGLSVWRSLGGAPAPAADGWWRDQCPAAQIVAAPRPQQPGPGTSHPPAVAAAAPGAAGLNTRAGKPVVPVPRLALGSVIGESGTAPGSGPAAVGAVAAAAAAAAAREGCYHGADAGPAPAAMEVDDGCGGRKRLRGPDIAQGGGCGGAGGGCGGAQTARSGPCAPSAAAGGAAANLAVPRTARAEAQGPMKAGAVGSLQLPLSGLGRGQAEADSPQRTPALRSKGVMPSLNFAVINGQKQSLAARPDAPAMLNLEEINMSEEELMNSYDPDNEENNYHLPHHLYKQLQLKHYRQVCSEVIPQTLYIGSYQVAGHLESLRKHQITHIMNTAADVCENRFPGQFTYTTYYLKDANTEDISLLFYRTCEWIQAAVSQGGRVLVHCREGVSRSATMVIAYLMWRFSLSFEAAHERLQKVRPICNPNTGFTCQLLMLAKRLGTSGGSGGHTPATPCERPLLFRVAPHHPKEPFLLPVPVERPHSGPLFDQRFGWVVQRGRQLVLWLGSEVPDSEAVHSAVLEHVRRLEAFERCQSTLAVAHEGEEPLELWQALDMPGARAEHGGLAARRPALDAEFEVLRALAEAASSRAGPEEDDGDGDSSGRGCAAVGAGCPAPPLSSAASPAQDGAVGDAAACVHAERSPCEEAREVIGSPALI